MHPISVVVLLLVLVFSEVQSSNVLFINGVGSPSHHIWNRALAFGLAYKGHNVTYIGPDDDTVSKPENYTFILLEGLYDEIHNNFDYFDMAGSSVVGQMQFLRNWSVFCCKKLLESKGLRYLWNYPKDFKFHLILVDVTFGPCLNHLIPRFGYPPTVAVTAFLLPPYSSFDFGNHLYPAYLPWYGLSHSHKMTFSQRVSNFFFTFLDVFQRNCIEYDEEEAHARKIFGNSLEPWRKIESHISLLLANTDPILDLPQPLPPNIIPVGGLHTRPPKKLPQDLQRILDDAKQGVVIFSLGTNIRSDKLTNDTRRALVNAFTQIPQIVVWKFESDIDSLPKNVFVKKWLPQNDVLGHPNVKLFIGHGGALSMQEAMYHGIPMIAIPFFADQHANMQSIIKKNFGLGVDIKAITTESFLGRLKEALNNPMYSENAKLISERFRSLPETPLQRAIFWSEYVMSHKGADFLSNPARYMPLYASSSADVIAFFFLFTLIIFLVMYKICTKFSSASRKKEQKKKLH